MMEIALVRTKLKTNEGLGFKFRCVSPIDMSQLTQPTISVTLPDNVQERVWRVYQHDQRTADPAGFEGALYRFMLGAAQVGSKQVQHVANRW